MYKYSMLFRKTGKRYLTICFIILSVSLDLMAGQVQIKGDLHQTTTTGYHLVKWQLGESPETGNAVFVLQQSGDPTFKNHKSLYEGPDLASFVSGLPDGNYFYRVGVKQDERVTSWSENLHLEVKHHSRNLAMLLFFLGTIIFLSTVAVIVVGNRKYNK